jgi:post-segregation antitoxin (ccd killing protein)
MKFIYESLIAMANIRLTRVLMRITIRTSSRRRLFMQLTYNERAVRRPVNLTANSELIDRVRSEKGNLSALFEQSMVTFLAERELLRWKEENQMSFNSYNQMIEARGTLSDDIGPGL